MGRMRFLALGIVSFVVAIVGTLLAPGTFVNRAFSAALCTLLSFNLTVCTVDLGRSSQRVVAANPPAVVADISDYLQAQRDPSEFGDEPSAPSPQQSNPQAPPFPQDPGPNFPVRREFDRPDQQPTVTRTIAFSPPTVRQLSPGTFELNLVSKEGCNFITTINSTGNRIYQSSTRFTPSSVEVCGIPAFTAHLSPDGTRMEVKVDASSESVVIEKIDDNSMKAVLKSATGETELGVFPIQERGKTGSKTLKTLGQFKQVQQFTLQKQTEGLTAQRQDSRGQAAFREATCTAGRRTCAGIATMGAVAGAMGLIPLPSSIPLEAIGAGATVFGYGCFVLFGGTPPLPFLPKPISTAYDFTTGMRYLSDEREARYRSGQAPGVRAPNDNPFDIATYGDRVSGSIRKALGIDFCDAARIAAQPPQTTPPKQPSQPAPPSARSCEQTQRQSTWILRFPGVQIRNGFCSITGYSEIPVTQNGQSLSAATEWYQQEQTGLRTGTTNLTGTITESGDAQMRITAPALGLTLEFNQSGKVFNQVRNELTAIRGSAVAQGCKNAISGSFEMRKQSTQEIASNPNCPPIATQSTSEVKRCRVPKEFFTTHRRVVAGIDMDDFICVIREPVITNGGFIDGINACGTCSYYGLPPERSSCNSRAIDPDRSNQVPTCPTNWAG